MNELSETVASIMISTRPSWLLPWVCGLSIVGAAVAVALVVCIVMAVAATVKQQAGGAK